MHLSQMPRSTLRRPQQPSRPIHYTPPKQIEDIPLSQLLQRTGRDNLKSNQLDMLRRGETTSGKDILIHFAGNFDVLTAPCISIVGTRNVSEPGRQRAAWLSSKLAQAGVSVVSGLAKGVDKARSPQAARQSR